MAIVGAHGARSTSSMLNVFEGYLEAKDVEDEESYDRVREGVVVFLGTLAQHLDPAEAKVHSPCGSHRMPSNIAHQCQFRGVLLNDRVVPDEVKSS